MKKYLFDYESGDNVETEVTSQPEELACSLKKSLKARRKPLLILVALIAVVLVVDAGAHSRNYNWYDWTETLSSEGTSWASTVAARYQLSDALLDYPDTKEMKKFYSAERKCAREELRIMGYRGSIPSKDWPEIN